MTYPDPLADARTDMLDAVEPLDASELSPLPQLQELPNKVYYQSLLWEKLLFRPGLGPHRTEAEVKRAYLLAGPKPFDLLRHEYTVVFEPPSAGGEEKSKERSEVRVAVTESSFALHVLFRETPPTERWGTEPLDRAKALAKAFLQLPAPPEDATEWKFTPIDGDPKYRVFSSDPGRTLTKLNFWHLRIDGAVRADGIVLICYKRHREYEELIPGGAWFDDEFRNRPKIKRP